MTQPLLSIKGLKTQFGTGEHPVKAVDGVDFEIQHGECVALVGESGCGKSIAALSIMRLLPEGAQIVAGEVCFKGVDLLRLPEEKMRDYRGLNIGFIFQDPLTSLNPVMSIGEQIVEAIMAHQQQPIAKAKNRAVELLQQVGIADAEPRYHSYPHELSGGMRQRVMIAIALSQEPDLLIADEPTTALDVTIQAQIMQLLKQLQEQMGMALLMITHELGLVADIADKVAVMYAGQLVEVTDKKVFFQQAAHPYSQRLFNALPHMKKRDRVLETIPDTVPSLSERFFGCRFANRCVFKQDQCVSEMNVRWHQLSPHQQVRCYFPKPVSEVGNNNQVAREKAEITRPVVLSVEDLKVHFPIKKGFFKRTIGHVKAVDGICLKLREGSTTALVGESGCGKSTFGKALVKLLDATSGQLVYKGDDISHLSESNFQGYRDQLQIIFQDPFSSMNPRMLVGDILEEGIRALKPNLNKTEVLEQCVQLLERVGLDASVRSRYPHEFSGGQRQRLCIARVLAVQPSVIICDEPTSALDVSVQAQVINLLKALQQEQQLSYLFITHDLAVVSYMADTVAVMYLGQIVEYGSVETLFKKPAHPYTQALMDAVPTWDDQHEKKVIRLPDDMPSPANPPSGCRFHTRCPSVMEQCKTNAPLSKRLSEEHEVSCWLY